MAHEVVTRRDHEAPFDPDFARIGIRRMQLERLIPSSAIERNSFDRPWLVSGLLIGRFPTHDLARRHNDRVPPGPPRSVLLRARRSVRSTGVAHPSRWFGPEKARTATPMLHRGGPGPRMVTRWLQHCPHRCPQAKAGCGHRRNVADAVADWIAPRPVLVSGEYHSCTRTAFSPGRAEVGSRMPA